MNEGEHPAEVAASLGIHRSWACKCRAAVVHVRPRTSRDFPNLINRIDGTPASRSTSSHLRPITLDRRMPVTVISPNRQ